MVRAGQLAAAAGLMPPQLHYGPLQEVIGIVFEVPPPHSKKNNTQPMRRGKHGPIRIGPRAVVRREARAMRQLVFEAIAQLGVVGPLFGCEDDIDMQVEHVLGRDVVRVTVTRLGPPLAVHGRTGRRRDLVNLFDSIADAMNGVLYGDDRQVARCGGRRCLGGAP
jgi:hypothetical protein